MHVGSFGLRGAIVEREGYQGGEIGLRRVLPSSRIGIWQSENAERTSARLSLARRLHIRRWDDAIES